MKTISFYVFCWLFLALSDTSSMYAQPGSYYSGSLALQRDVTRQAAGMNTGSDTASVYPVWFHYSRRKLMYRGGRLDGSVFLAVCRNIQDSAVQEQVARYDELSREKQRLGFGMLGSGFAGFALLGGAVTSEEPELSGMLGLTAGIAILAVPVIAICSTKPHQARKAILFRDLPVAYNAYFEACRQRQLCTQR